MPRAKPRWGWRFESRKLPDLPAHLVDAVRTEMQRFLPVGLSDEEREAMLAKLLSEFLEARQYFADAKILRNGATREQILAALVDIKGRVDHVITGLESLDDVSAQALEISNQPVPARGKDRRRGLAGHFKGVWDLQTAIDHALVQFRSPNPDNRSWPNWFSIAPVMMSSAISSKGDPFRRALFFLAQGIELATETDSGKGSAPTAYWSPDDDAVRGSFVPVVELLAKAIALDKSNRLGGTPARVAQIALRDFRSWRVEYEEMVQQGNEEDAARREEEKAHRATEEG
jgi:hypothetical protein